MPLKIIAMPAMLETVEGQRVEAWRPGGKYCNILAKRRWGREW